MPTLTSVRTMSKLFSLSGLLFKFIENMNKKNKLFFLTFPSGGELLFLLPPPFLSLISKF